MLLSARNGSLAAWEYIGRFQNEASNPDGVVAEIKHGKKVAIVTIEEQTTRPSNVFTPAGDAIFTLLQVVT